LSANDTGDKVSLSDKLGDKTGARLVKNGSCGPNLLKTAVVHHRNFIAEEERLFLIMGHKNGCRPSFLEQVLHFLAHGNAQRSIEIGEGFV
jgi:hypothetical protein